MKALTKVCNSCKNEKPLEEFDKNKTCRDGRTGTCSSCNSAYRREWYQKNKDRHLNNGRENRRRWKQIAVASKGDICFDCKQTFPHCCYDFHHLDPKEKDMSIGQMKSLKRIMKEIEKCVMLCANCHRIRHFNQEGN